MYLMILLLLLFTELFFLFFLSQWLTQSLFDLCILVFRARSVAITIVTILNFPGTVIHELSHLFTAEVLGVRTGKLTLVPATPDTQDKLAKSLRAGSVMIAETDPFRRYLIGLAPILSGLVAIAAISYAIYWGTWGAWGYWGGIFLLLAIGNSMFSSAEDLKGFLPFIITLAIMAGAAYFAGLRVGITGPALALATRILDALTKSLGIVLALNIAGIILTKLLIFLTEKLTRRKILRR